MSDTASAARAIAQAETAADEAEALAERMRAIGAWGAYAALQDLARAREARVDRLRTMRRQAMLARARIARAGATHR